MIDISDAEGKIIRHFSSSDSAYKIPAVNIPLYWIRPQQILSSEAGSHRFVWDLHYPPLDLPPSYPIAAIYKNTDPDATSPWVLPGSYTVTLTVSGTKYAQPLIIKMDPRIKTSGIELKKQHDLSMQVYQYHKQVILVQKEMRSVRLQLQQQVLKATGELLNKLKQLDQEAASLESNAPGQSFNRLNNDLNTLFSTLQDTDMPVTTQASRAVSETQQTFKQLMDKWVILKKRVVSSE
jgi:hypothetical protein